MPACLRVVPTNKDAFEEDKEYGKILTEYLCHSFFVEDIDDALLFENVGTAAMADKRDTASM